MTPDPGRGPNGPDRTATDRAAARARIALIIAALSALWLLRLMVFGGVDVTVLGMRLRASAWLDPAIVCGVALWIFSRQRRQARGLPVRPIRETVTALLRRWLTPDALLLTLVLVVAATVRFWGLTFGLPHPSVRPDEDAVSSMARGFYGGTFKPAGFNYPPLFVMLVAAAMWVGTRRPLILKRLNIDVPAPELDIPTERMSGRILSAFAGVVNVWILFRVGMRLFDRTTALVSALFLALAFLHVRDSHFGVTDIPMTCMVLAGFLAIVRLSESGSHRDLVVAGVVSGLAVATKYNAALLAFPATFAILSDPMRRPFGVRAGRVFAFGVVMTAAFLAVFPHAILSHDEFLAAIAFESRHLAEGHAADLGKGWLYHPTVTLRHGLGIPLLSAGIGGLALMVWRDRRKGILVSLFPLAYYVVIGNGRTVFARYALPLVPFLCLGAGYLVTTTVEVLTKRFGHPAWRIAATAALAGAVLLPSARSVIAFDRLLAREDTRLTARRWITAHVAPASTITQVGNGRLYYGDGAPFVVFENLTSDRTTLIIVTSSALFPWPVLRASMPWLEREYELQFIKTVVDEDDPAHVYDRQDEFYLPLGGFHQIEQPGPNVRIFVRRNE